MSSSTLDEAITKGFCIGPVFSVVTRTRGEIRDFMAHQLMYFMAEHGFEPGGHNEALFLEFFERIFNENNLKK